MAISKSLTLKDKEFQKTPMRAKNEHIRLAESYKDRYRETRNIWDIIEASRHYFEAAKYTKSADIVLGISESLYHFGYMDKAKELNIQTINTTREKRKATALNNLANIYNTQGNYQEALKWYEKSIKIFEKIGNQAGLATTYNNIGEIHRAQGNYQEALKWYEKSNEKIGDQAGLATTYNNIASIHYAQGNYQEALKWYEKSIKI
ncbi:MAG: tetratricopeptide repeat protein, partial [bacterium]|nr:tetratricopeptide repeat protein [bacterium]